MPLDVVIAKRLREFTLDVSFSVGDKPLSILGPSGAGKSMLFRCIAGLETPDRGRIVLNERVLFDSRQRVQLLARDRRVGMLFQHYALFPHRTVAQNILFGVSHLSREEQAKRLAAAVGRTHIAGFEPRFPRELSGGEQQRVALARALAIEPEVLLLDEPLSALDTHLRSQMESQLQEVFADYKRPTLLVTHNIEEAYRLGEQLLVLSRGRVAAFGEKEEIFRRPQNLEVARVTGCKNFSRARAISSSVIDALDWNCQLRVADPIPENVVHVGIRAHQIDFIEAGEQNAVTVARNRQAAQEENVFPCWLARSSGTPFRVTLFLKLHEAPRDTSDYHLQAEVFKEKWQRFRDSPQPWHVRLFPEFLFLLSE